MTSPIDKMLDSLPYKETGATPSDDGIPHVTHESVLTIGGFSLRVYVLSTGVRVIDADDLERFFGVDEQGG